MHFHVVSLPHTITSKEYCACAYTQKVLNFCKMMTSLGHTVYHYGGEGSEVAALEHITTVSSLERAQFFGSNDWKKDFFAVEWDSRLPYWQLANSRAVSEITQRLSKKDFICLIGGNCQKPIADAFPAHMSVEFGIGYTGVFAPYKVFESYSHMHWVYGYLHDDTGKFFDTVIPNYFDEDDFPIGTEKEDYYLFVGRTIDRKGYQIAIDTTEAMGAKLVMAGQGASGMTFPDHVSHVGTVDVKTRGTLMSRAKALFAPTTYIEPFGGVAVEAMMCGTPVIATDFGAFTETVINGFTGYRIHTLGEAIDAAQKLSLFYKTDFENVAQYARKRYSLDTVKWMYQDYFKRLLTLWGEGWYQKEYDPTARDMVLNSRTLLVSPSFIA